MQARVDEYFHDEVDRLFNMSLLHKYGSDLQLQTDLCCNTVHVDVKIKPSQMHIKL